MGVWCDRVLPVLMVRHYGRVEPSYARKPAHEKKKKNLPMDEKIKLNIISALSLAKSIHFEPGVKEPPAMPVVHLIYPSGTMSVPGYTDLKKEFPQDNELVIETSGKSATIKLVSSALDIVEYGPYYIHEGNLAAFRRVHEPSVIQMPFVLATSVFLPEGGIGLLHECRATPIYGNRLTIRSA